MVLTAAFVALGAAPGSDLGPGLSRLAPVLDAVLAAIVAGLLVVSPWEGLVAWIVVMPILNVARAQFVAGSFQLILPSLLIPALALGWFLSARSGPLRSGSQQQGAPVAATWRDPVRLAWLVAAVIIVLAVASPAVRGDLAGLTISLHGFVEPAVLGALVVTLRPTRRQLLALLIAIGVSAALASAYSIVRIGKIASTLAQAETLRVNLARFTYYNVGIFGDILAMSTPLLLGVAILRRGLRPSRRAVIAAVVALGVSLIAVYLTYSKSAWVGVYVGLFVVSLLAVRGFRQRLALTIVAALLAAVVVPYPQYILRAAGLDASGYTKIVGSLQGSRFTSWDPDTAVGEVSITERVLATTAALRMAVDHPVLGVGPGRFQAEYAGPYHVAGATRGLGNAHDMIPDIAAEYGLIMALLVIAVLIVSFAGILTAYRRDGPLGRALAVMVGAALLGFVIVATTFGLDFYRPYRFMNSDVLVAALLMAAAVVIGHLAGRARPARSAQNGLLPNA